MIKKVITVKNVVQEENQNPSGLESVAIPAYTNGYYAVHKQLNDTNLFTVTHLQSGHALKKNFPTAKEAMAFGEIIMKHLPTSWLGWKRTRGIDFTMQELKDLSVLVDPNRKYIKLNPMIARLELL